MSAVNFRKFIESQLRVGGMSDLSISRYTDDHMHVFGSAFTHSSYDEKNNYEYLEFRGDVIVNMITVQYLQRRFPRVVSVQWLTKLKHNFSGKMSLYQIALDNGFERYIQHHMRDHEDIKYISMLEDVVEAFFGAIMTISGKSLGVGYAICYNILSSYYDKRNVSLKWEEVFDPVTRTKEIYDELGWDFKKNLHTRLIAHKNTYVSELRGYPNGDKTEKQENQVVVSYGYAPTAEESKTKTCLFGIRTLRQKYGIEDTVPSPYTMSKESEENIQNPAPDIPPGFKEFITKLLRQARVKKNMINLMTQEENLIEFRLSFVHNSYDPEVNYNLFKYEGVTALDLIVVEYFARRFPDVHSEKWLTNMKHTLISKKQGVGNLANISISDGYSDFILYGGKIKESLEKYPDKDKNPLYLKMLGDVVKAFTGALVRIFDKVKGRGVGVVVAYNYIVYHLNQISISVDYADIFNYKSRLKELYDSYGWVFDKSISVVFDQESGEHVATIVGYPKGNRSRDPRNEVKLSTSSGRTKKDAEQQASKLALEKLDNTYKIRGARSTIV